jgi:hypothetical protein
MLGPFLALVLTSASLEVQAPPVVTEDAPTHVGLWVDAGVPDGAGVSLVFRPMSWLRLHAGATHNDVAPGIRGGVSFVPWSGIVTVSVTVEGGHYFEGNANSLARLVLGDAAFNSAYLQKVNYDYVNGHLGLEIGSQRRFVFFIHGGMSQVWGTVHSFEAGLQSSGGTSYTASPASVRALMPSAKVGFVLFFF